MEQKDLFRKSALEKLASPERLDVLMQVTSPAGWISLWTIAVVLLLVLAWSIFGSLPERIDGQGILISGGGLREINATGDGVLSGLTVKMNDAVKPTQVIGEVTLGGTEDTVRQAEAKLREAQQAFELGRLDDSQNINGLNASIAGQRAEITRLEADLERARRNLELREKQLAERVTTTRVVEEARQNVSVLDSRLNAARQTINSYQAQQRSYSERTRQRQQAVEAAKLELESLQNRVARTTQITATVEGRVVELRKNPGDRVRAGEVIAVVEPPSAAMQAIVYVNSSTGKRIGRGREAQIAPTTVKREEYGFMKGEVDYISEFPATPDSMMNALRNSSLVEELLGGSSKIEMRAALIRDPRTPSGYQWSSSSGPPFKVNTGTRVTVSVVVDRQRPIAKVLPFLRSTFGAS
jgi:HlyD family secretion protein